MERNQIPKEDTRKARLFQLLLEIPAGKAVSYGELARVLGTSPRAVAAMLKSNREQDRYPCYKVVASDGSLGGYNLGPQEKIRRLRADGAPVSSNRFPKEGLFRFPS